MRRTPNAADEAAKAQVIAEQEGAKKQKAVARIAKMKAKQSGEASNAAYRQGRARRDQGLGDSD
jgi:hypothetical protein